jgi:membrane-associated phospholipid phosphatase
LVVHSLISRIFFSIMDKCLIFDVSWHHDQTLWQWVGIFYGYTLMLWFPSLCLYFLLETRGTREAWYISLVLVSLVSVEITKYFVHQPRPDGPCQDQSYGMPSNHATLAVGSSFLVILDVSTSAFNNTNHYASLMLTLFLLAPVPYSRVLLNDHYPAQVLVGCGIGLFLGGLWFLVGKYLRDLYADRLDKTVLWFLNHNYPPVTLKEHLVSDEGGTEKLLSAI